MRATRLHPHSSPPFHETMTKKPWIVPFCWTSLSGGTGKPPASCSPLKTTQASFIYFFTKYILRKYLSRWIRWF